MLYGHVYFVSIGPKIAKIFEKFAAIKSLLNPHFKGFGAITRSGFCWSCFSDHFGMVDVPFRPMNDHFVTILVFFAVFVGRRVPFFGHSLLSYSKRRHLSTSRVIPLIDCHQSLWTSNMYSWVGTTETFFFVEKVWTVPTKGSFQKFPWYLV